MKKRLLIIGIIVAAMLAGSIAFAQTSTQSSTSPVSSPNVLDKLKNIKLPGMTFGSGSSATAPSGVSGNGIWQIFNVWLKGYIGINLSDIIKFVAHIVATVFLFIASIFTWIETHV